ncbi:MAG TPA: ABC transporter permease [Acidimicrobiales bacterium]|nr:ABC transporter permease [Acidimicrobiales bacterium]
MSALIENLRIALQGIVANRLRAVLTTLGVLIGVASVILLLAVGNGSSQQIQQSINKLGTNFLTISPGSNGFGALAATLGLGGRFGARIGTQSSAAQLTMADVSALSNHKQAPDIQSVAPVVNASETCVAGAYSYQPSTFVGTTPAYQNARGYTMASGQFISSNDVNTRAPVVDIGQTVATSLFPGANPVGQSLQCGRTTFTVEGLFDPKGTNGVQDLDSVIVAPITTVQSELSGFAGLSSITIEATNSSTINSAQAEATEILMQAQGITNIANVDFSIANQASLLSTSTSTSKTFTALLGAVAAISLLVGGIGVMNIMLVTVTERTREIGIRKAVGATKGAIMTQFLTEAIVLSVIGGGLGILAALIGSHFMIDGVKPVIESWSVFMAFGVAVLIGLFFGAYPANRAASLNPIDALRYE